MERIVKAFKFGGVVSTLIGNMLDRILAAFKFGGEISTFTNEYLHEHPDETDNVYTVIKSFNPSVSIIMSREKKSLIRNPREKFFNNDQEQIIEAIVKKRLQSGEDQILYRKSLQSEEDEEMKNIIKQKNISI